MKGPTAEERRTDELQALTFIGLLADELSLATIHYPALKPSEERALSNLAGWIAPASPTNRRESPIRRRKSISDPAELLQHAAVLAQEADSPTARIESLDFLRAPLRSLLDGT